MIFFESRKSKNERKLQKCEPWSGNMNLVSDIALEIIQILDKDKNQKTQDDTSRDRKTTRT